MLHYVRGDGGQKLVPVDELKRWLSSHAATDGTAGAMVENALLATLIAEAMALVEDVEVPNE